MDCKYTQKTTFYKRAKSKARTVNKCLALARLDSPLHNQYLKTLQCGESVFSNTEGKLVSCYCGSNICNVCQRIRIAKFINGYVPVLKQELDEGDLFFVTLTIPCVKEENLAKSMDDMTRLFGNISRERHKKKGGFMWREWAGLRKLECTYNPYEDWYHPHYHVIIKGEGQARWLVNKWMAHWARRGVECSPNAQDIRKADDQSFKELAKYVIKDSLPTGMSYSSSSAKESLLAAQKLDVMYVAMKGRRTFQNFGSLKKRPPAEEDIEGLQSQNRPEGKEGHYYEWCGYDWVDKFTGERLGDYEPSERERAYLKNLFSTDLDQFLEPRVNRRKKVLFVSPERRATKELAFLGELEKYIDVELSPIQFSERHYTDVAETFLGVTAAHMRHTKMIKDAQKCVTDRLDRIMCLREQGRHDLVRKYY